MSAPPARLLTGLSLNPVGAFRLSFHFLKPVCFSAPHSCNTRFPPIFYGRPLICFFYFKKMAKANQVKSFLSLNHSLPRSLSPLVSHCPHSQLSGQTRPIQLHTPASALPRDHRPHALSASFHRPLQGAHRFCYLEKSVHFLITIFTFPLEDLPRSKLLYWGTLYVLSCSSDREPHEARASTGPAAEAPGLGLDRRFCRLFKEQRWSNARGPFLFFFFFYWVCLLPGTRILEVMVLR